MSLPKFIVLKAPGSETYLGPKATGKFSGYAEFAEPTVVSSNAKFEVEFSKNGLVHIRSCVNNKYLVRTRNPAITGKPKEEYWLTVTAKAKEEDQSKETCTLFKPILKDSVYNNFHLVHVQSGCYLRLRPLSNSELGRGVLASNNQVDPERDDIFKVIDWESLVIMPRFVAFKGNNDSFLRLTQIEGHPYLQFSSNDIGDADAAMEVFYMKNGDIRFKPISSDRFWRRSPNWIWADSATKPDDRHDSDTLFRAFKVDSKTIALLNLGNNRFCKRLTAEGKTSCLNAAVPSITKEAFLTVAEPLLSRHIENVQYDIDQSRVYDEKALVVAMNSASNHTNQANTMDVKLTYTETTTSTWKSHYSLTLGAKGSYELGVPMIWKGTVELSAEYERGVEWGETRTTSTVMEVNHTVKVPPMSKVTVKLIMTNGKCDVPFTYTQKDTLYNGKVVSTVVKGNTYNGSNYYNINYDTVQEPLTS